MLNEIIEALDAEIFQASYERGLDVWSHCIDPDEPDVYGDLLKEALAILRQAQNV